MTQKHVKTGGCQCGKIRYALHQSPTVIYLCHCTECQKQSSSAFGISVRVEASALEVSGETASFERPSPSGAVICEFCPTCGTRLFHRRLSYAEKLNIKGGTFDDKSWLRPAGHIWTDSKLPWVVIPTDALSYPQQPDDYDELTAIYAKRAVPWFNGSAEPDEPLSGIELAPQDN